MRRGLDARPSDVDETGGRRFLTRTRSRWLSAVVWLALFSQSGCPEPALTPEDYSWASEDLTAVAILDANEALVVSRSGSIYRTDDAGGTFRRVHADPSAALFDLSMFDAELGWAVGSGRILATRNGGRSWRVQPLPEGREAVELRGVHVLDTHHVLAVGLSGVRLRTENAGRSWDDRTEAVRTEAVASAERQNVRESGPLALPVEISFDADLHDVVCVEGGGNHCVSLGGEGGAAYSIDRGENWVASRRMPLLPFEPIEMPDGAVELSAKATDRIIDLAEQLGGRSDVSIRVEAIAGEGEIERASRQRDPEPLFEILEARALDAAGALETAGIAADRIAIRAAPPWGYEELLDDDPGYLDRYWRGRRAGAPGVHVFVVDERPMHAGVSVDVLEEESASQDQRMLAVGAAGAIWHSLDGGESWGMPYSDGDADLFAAAQERTGLIVAGDRGTMQASVDMGESWRRHTWGEKMIVTEGLLDLDFSRDSSIGLIVGRAGLILKRGAEGEGWKRIVASKP